MKCHACAKPMRRDRYGHPIHDGLCPGYPVPYTSRMAECANCGGTTTERALPQHHEVCTPDRPQLPSSASRSRRICPMCALPPKAHKVPCVTEAPTWPAEPLLEALWARVPERTYEAAQDKLGFRRKTWPRPGEVLSTDQADRLATRIGLHPALIWPDWFDAALTVMDRLKADNRAWRHMWLEDEQTDDAEVAA